MDYDAPLKFAALGEWPKSPLAKTGPVCLLNTFSLSVQSEAE